MVEVGVKGGLVYCNHRANNFGFAVDFESFAVVLHRRVEHSCWDAVVEQARDGYRLEFNLYRDDPSEADLLATVRCLMTTGQVDCLHLSCRFITAELLKIGVVGNMRISRARSKNDGFGMIVYFRKPEFFARHGQIFLQRRPAVFAMTKLLNSDGHWNGLWRIEVQYKSGFPRVSVMRHEVHDGVWVQK